MMAAERTTKILEIINATGAVKVEQLAKELGVSEMTIRRDLEKCDKNGSLQRCHGGAILKSNIQREMDYDEKRQTHQGAKGTLPLPVHRWWRRDPLSIWMPAPQRLKLRN